MNFKSTALGLLLVLPFAAGAQLSFNTSGYASDYEQAPDVAGNFNINDFQAEMLVPANSPWAPSHWNSWTSNDPTLPGGASTAYMLVNGGDPSANMWSEMMNAGSNDTFSFYATAVYSGDTASSGTAATLQLLVDGNDVGAAQQIVYNNANPGQMALYSVNLGLLTSGPHLISIEDTNGAFGGNDFAVAATPEPAPFAALGLGALVVLRRRKK